jgi:hypothetical protein
MKFSLSTRTGSRDSRTPVLSVKRSVYSDPHVAVYQQLGYARFQAPFLCKMITCEGVFGSRNFETAEWPHLQGVKMSKRNSRGKLLYPGVPTLPPVSGILLENVRR